jgi:hypothetical protein
MESDNWLRTNCAQSLVALRADPLIELQLSVPIDLFVPSRGVLDKSPSERPGLADLPGKASGRPVMIFWGFSFATK